MGKRDRKYRTKSLPFYQKILYHSFLLTEILLFFIPAFSPILVSIIHEKRTPYNAVTLSEGSSLIMLMFAGFGIGTIFSLLFDFLANRGLIQKLENLYSYDFCSAVPFEVNMLVCFILFVVFVPILILNLNAYKYMTDDYICLKYACSFEEEKVYYTDIEDINLSESPKSGDTVDISYKIKLKNGKKFTIGSNYINDEENQKIMSKFEKNGFYLQIPECNPEYD